MNIEKLKSLSTGEMSEWQQVGETLNKDERHARDELDSNPDSQFWRRTVVRTFFAAVEGEIHQWKRQALLLETVGIAQLDDGQRSILKEETYDLKENGSVKSRPLFTKTDQSLRFCINLINDAVNAGYELDLGEDNRWNSFKQAIGIRNRLMHPRSSDELEVTDDEVSVVRDAIAWFREVYGDFAEAVAKGLAKYVAAALQDQDLRRSA